MNTDKPQKVIPRSVFSEWGDSRETPTKCCSWIRKKKKKASRRVIAYLQLQFCFASAQPTVNYVRSCFLTSETTPFVFFPSLVDIGTFSQCWGHVRAIARGHVLRVSPSLPLFRKKNTGYSTESRVCSLIIGESRFYISFLKSDNRRFLADTVNKPQKTPYLLGKINP